MQLEFHELERRWEHLRVREAQQQRRLLGSLAEGGQQTPIVVVRSKQDGRYIVIDGYKRIAALQQLGRDTVQATVWEMSEADAVLLERSLRFSKQETALEQGWLLAEMQQRFGYTLEELGQRFDRSVSWVSRRLALVELLPEIVQQQVREGKIAAQAAMRYLAPMARVSLEQCKRMAAAFVEQRCDARQAAQLYTAWREGSRTVRERVLAEPGLFLKTQRQAAPEPKPAGAELQRDLEMAAAILRRAGRRLSEALGDMNPEQREQAQRQMESARRELDRITERFRRERADEHVEPGAENRDSGAERERGAHTGDCARVEALAPERAQSAALEHERDSGHSARRESGTVPAADSGAFGGMQEQPGTSP